MNSRFVIVCVVALYASAVQGGVQRRDAGTLELPSLQDLVTQAEQQMATFTSNLQSLFTPGEEQQAAFTKVGDTLTNQTQALAEHVQTLVNNLNEAVKNGQTNDALSQAAERLNGTLRQLLGEENADQAQRASAQISSNVQDAVKTVVEEASKIAKSVDSETAPLREELGAATRTALNQALEAAQFFQTQLQQAAGQAPAPAAA